MTTPANGGLMRLLDHIEETMSGGFGEVKADIKALETEVQRLAATKLSKQEYDQHRKVRRDILLWGIGVIVTIAIATWTIVSTRPEIIIESLGL